MKKQSLVALSKFLSLVLRHRPEVIGLALDASGWVDIEELLNKARAHGKHWDRATLLKVVTTNDKKRFSFSEDGKRIRAVQGHSIPVSLGLEPREPPPLLFHGTASRSLASILERGLQARGRQYVHLSTDMDTAQMVGRRHGTPVVLKINTLRMFQAGYHFYLAENGVWLTEKVPPEFITTDGPV